MGVILLPITIVTMIQCGCGFVKALPPMKTEFSSLIGLRGGGKESLPLGKFINKLKHNFEREGTFEGIQTAGGGGQNNKKKKNSKTLKKRLNTTDTLETKQKNREKEDAERLRKEAVRMSRVRRWRDQQFDGFRELRIRIDSHPEHMVISIFVRLHLSCDSMFQRFPRAANCTYKRAIFVCGAPLSAGRMDTKDLQAIFSAFGTVSFTMLHPSHLGAIVCFASQDSALHAYAAGRS
eukprot:jgi/Bigna1/128448/aug1.6_g3156